MPHQEHEPSAAREYVGRILAYFRQRANMTQAELGRRIFCTDSLIAQWFSECDISYRRSEHPLLTDEVSVFPFKIHFAISSRPWATSRKESGRAKRGY